MLQLLKFSLFGQLGFHFTVVLKLAVTYKLDSMNSQKILIWPLRKGLGELGYSSTIEHIPYHIQ